jgi:hypothetical protein
MIVAACGSDGDPEGLGLQDVKEGTRCSPEGDKSQSQKDQQLTLASIVSSLGWIRR